MIDLESLTEEAVEQVFDLLPTAVTIGSYIKYASGRQISQDYDPVEDKPMEPVSVIPDVRMIMVSADEKELAGTNITINDVKFLIPAKDLPGIQPSNLDDLSIPGKTFDIIKRKVLPVKTLYILFGREK